MALVYVTEAEVTDYTGIDPVDTDLLEEAQAHIDQAIGGWGTEDINSGLKLVPVQDLLPYQRVVLARAVAFQYEYMVLKGPDFFVNFRPQSQSGPDGSVEGQEPFIGPKAQNELSRGRLYRLVGRAASRFPNQTYGNL